MSTVASLACTTAPVSTAAPRTNQHLIASIYHPLSAPNQANTSGEFKPLTSQKFLCNNRLGFWWFNSILVLWLGGGGSAARGWGSAGGRGAAKALSPRASLPFALVGPSWDTRPPDRALGDMIGHLGLPQSQPLRGRSGLCLDLCPPPLFSPRPSSANGFTQGGLRISRRKWPGP